MQGCIILCTVHRQAHNASRREWQIVPQEMFSELLDLAKELGDVAVYEGCCPECNAIASASFNSLYGHRYAEAMQRELPYDVRPAYDASEE